MLYEYTYPLQIETHVALRGQDMCVCVCVCVEPQYLVHGRTHKLYSQMKMITNSTCVSPCITSP